MTENSKSETPGPVPSTAWFGVLSLIAREIIPPRQRCTNRESQAIAAMKPEMGSRRKETSMQETLTARPRKKLQFPAEHGGLRRASRTCKRGQTTPRLSEASARNAISFQEV